MEVADETLDFDLDRIDELVTRLIGHAHLARAYGDAMQRDPQLIAGFGRLADRHCAAVETLGSEIGVAARALTQPQGLAAPFGRRLRSRA